MVVSVDAYGTLLNVTLKLGCFCVDKTNTLSDDIELHKQQFKIRFFLQFELLKTQLDRGLNVF